MKTAALAIDLLCNQIVLCNITYLNDKTLEAENKNAESEDEKGIYHTADEELCCEPLSHRYCTGRFLNSIQRSETS